MSVPKPFVYTPLGPGQIRLLEYHAGEGGREPGWAIKIVTLGEAGQDVQDVDFDALSYTWGPMGDTFPLILNDQEIQIQKSLHIALPYLSQRPSSRPIWVDAVCINQKDEDEKTVQIRKMSEIYQRATQVWVWLGPGLGDTATAEAINLLPLIARVGDQNLPEPPELPPPSDPVWNSVLDIISNGWYSRVWIVQESALARDLRFLVGTHELSGGILEAVVTTSGLLAERFYNHKPPMLAEASKLHDSQKARAIFGIRDVVQKSFSDHAANPDKPRTPRQLVWIIYVMSQNSQCFNPHDRVFGSLGLLPAHQRDQLGDFSYKTSLQDLYAGFGQQILTQPDPAAAMWFALLHRGTMAKKVHGLPSWCPDFHQTSEHVAWYEDGISLGLDTRKGFHASNKNIAAFPGASIHELVSRGCLVDEISDIYGRIPIDDDLLRSQIDKTIALDAYSHLDKFERHVAKDFLSPQAFELTTSPEPYTEVEGEDKARINSFWKTLLGGFRTFQGAEVTLETYYALRRGLAKLAASGDVGSQQHSEAFSSLVADGLFQKGFYCAMYSILHRRVFVTSAGRLGLGGRSMKIGDNVFLFNGGPVPHVVRHDSGAKYSLICEAYLSDAMQGELEELDFAEMDITLM